MSDNNNNTKAGGKNNTTTTTGVDNGGRGNNTNNKANNGGQANSNTANNGGQNKNNTANNSGQANNSNTANNGGQANNSNTTNNGGQNKNNTANNSNTANNGGQNKNNTANNSGQANNVGQNNNKDTGNNNNQSNEGQGGGLGVQVPSGSGFQSEKAAPLDGKQSGNKNSSSSGTSSTTVNIVAGVVGVGVVFILLAIICVMCSRRRKRKNMDPRSVHPYGNQQWQHGGGREHGVKMAASGGWNSRPYSAGSNMQSSTSEPPPNLQLGFNQSTFSYEELAAATRGFDQANMLGQGGFGYVHKGVLPNGKEIAVKSLKSGSGQGDREFHAEVEIISRVHHKHLVSLAGYCIAEGQRMLVYEFVPNGTLEHHLHKKGNPPLDFSTRLRIALGSAKGLSYLHEDCYPRIIHRDIKASNILLEYNFEAMVADFGLAKLTNDTNTHVSTRVMGTFGYLAPEYASSGKLTEKSDVFSFGVMLLELITGRRPVDPDMKYMEDSLVDWSRPLMAKALETGNYHELADPRLEGNYNPQEMQRMVACADASIRHSSKKRPKMSQIVRALEGDVSLEDLNNGIAKPGQPTAFSSPDSASDYDTRQYSADLKKFRQLEVDTQDFTSSEYGGTADYGMNSSQ